MPELPEVETVRRGLERTLVGKMIRDADFKRPDLRFPFPKNLPSLLSGRTIEAIDRRAKYLLIRLDSKKTLLCHLGMSGRWTVVGGGIRNTPGRFANGASIGTGEGPHDWVVIHLDDETLAVYSDHRRFGFMDFFSDSDEEDHKMLCKLGPEPTPGHLTPSDLAEKLRGRKTPIKSALLDQRTVAGLGNIYVCEILFRAHVSPKRKASTVAGKNGISKMVERITFATHDVISEAIDAGGSTLQDFRGVDGEEALGYFSHNFQVYGREGEDCPDPNCSGKIKRIVQSNRSTFFCSLCQR